MVKVDQVYKNQSEIVKRLNQLVNEEANVNIPQLKKKYKKEWAANRLQIMQDSSMKITALAQGKDPEQFIKEV